MHTSLPRLAALALLFLAGCGTTPSLRDSFSLRDKLDPDAQEQTHDLQQDPSQLADTTGRQSPHLPQDANGAGLQQPAPSAAEKLEENIRQAQLAEEAGQNAQARTIYQNVLQQQPLHAVANHRMAILADKEGRFADAERHYKLALQQAPRNTDLLSDIGYSYVLQGRLEESEAALQQALAYQPGHPTARSNLGLLYGKRAQLTGSAEDYNRAFDNFRLAAGEQQAREQLQQLFPQGPPTGASLPAATTPLNPFQPALAGTGDGARDRIGATSSDLAAPEPATKEAQKLLHDVEAERARLRQNDARIQAANSGSWPATAAQSAAQRPLVPGVPLDRLRDEMARIDAGPATLTAAYPPHPLDQGPIITPAGAEAPLPPAIQPPQNPAPVAAQNPPPGWQNLPPNNSGAPSPWAAVPPPAGVVPASLAQPTVNPGAFAPPPGAPSPVQPGGNWNQPQGFASAPPNGFSGSLPNPSQAHDWVNGGNPYAAPAPAQAQGWEEAQRAAALLGLEAGTGLGQMFPSQTSAGHQPMAPGGSFTSWPNGNVPGDAATANGFGAANGGVGPSAMYRQYQPPTPPQPTAYPTPTPYALTPGAMAPSGMAPYGTAAPGPGGSAPYGVAPPGVLSPGSPPPGLNPGGSAWGTPPQGTGAPAGFPSQGSPNWNGGPAFPATSNFQPSSATGFGNPVNGISAPIGPGGVVHASAEAARFGAGPAPTGSNSGALRGWNSLDQFESEQRIQNHPGQMGQIQRDNSLNLGNSAGGWQQP